MSVKKLLQFCSVCARLSLGLSLFITPVTVLFGQTAGATNTFLVPIVTIRATDPLATWTGDPGTFSLFRQGPTNAALNIYCRIGGTASNGVDYATISSFTVIPAGARSNTITIWPINNGQTDTRTVELGLRPSPTTQPGNPANYIIGSPSNAVVYLRPSSSNLPPVTRIISPANGAIFHAPVNVPLYAYARDPDDAVASVEFLEGSNHLGFGIPLPLAANSAGIVGSVSNIYLFVWSNAPAGTYVLTSRATDTRGASGVSEPVKIAILPPRPPPTNRPPIVNIVASDPVAIEGTNCWVWPGVTNPVPTWGNWPGAMTACRLFTNCGPKDAIFTVHRFGDTNKDVVVHYAIGGTATNGVDYVALPGVVTVSAGQRDVFIPIVPIDDGPPDITSTVILKLLPDTNYVIGFPPKAAAIILDGVWPRATAAFVGGCFRMNATGPDGAWFHIEYSTDLARWIPLCTNQVIQGAIDFVDPDASADQSRFYRAVPESGPPPY